MKINKLIILLATATLVAACQSHNSSKSVNSNEESTSGQITSSDTKTPSTSESESQPSSSESKSSASSNSSSSSQGGGSEVSSPYGANPILDSNYILKKNEETCATHELEESIIWPASIVSKGVKRKTCANCGGFYEEFYYDLDELAFESKTFAYDGNERTLYIEGMLPYGVTVQYENNKLTEIGTKEATAKFLNEKNEQIGELKANITIVENAGFPNVKVTTATGKDPDYREKEEYTSMTTTIDNCDEEWAIKDKKGGIRVRGNSTNQASVNKRAWRLKFEAKQNLLGLNGGPKGKGFKSWVLLADNFDYSYFRNMTAFSFGNSLFNYSNNYASHYQHVNFYMNGEYRGIYLLAEQQQSNEGRITINESEGYEGTDTGYLVEIDGLVSTGQSDEEYTFYDSANSGGGWGPWGGGGGGDTVNGRSISSKGYCIKTDVFGKEQAPFIEKYIKNVRSLFISACKGEQLKVLDKDNNLVNSPYKTQYETLNSIIDLDSLFKTYVLQEFMKNYDCGWGSFYLFVDFSSSSIHPRLTFGAPWDFDLGEGNKQNQGDNKSTGDFITTTTGMTEFNPWLYLLSQTDFFNELFTRYYSVFATSKIYEKSMQNINYETSAFADEFAKEYAKWGGDSGRTSMGIRTDYRNHSEAVSYLTKWYSERKAYLDNKWIRK